MVNLVKALMPELREVKGLEVKGGGVVLEKDSG
jgi:hypothetical protein